MKPISIGSLIDRSTIEVIIGWVLEPYLLNSLVVGVALYFFVFLSLFVPDFGGL